MHSKQEKLGEILILIEMLLFSIFPIIMNVTTKLMPPILFAALTTILASIFFFLQLAYKKNLKEIFHRKSLKYNLGVTFFIVIIPSILIFKGSKLTSGINTAIFLQMEILFALPICALLLKEKITKFRLISSLIITTGAVLVLYNGTFKINLGDLLIILGTMLYPIGNVFAKKSLSMVSPITILFIRSFVGGLFLLLISLIFENSADQIIPSVKQNLWAIIVSGIVVMGISKILWYEGLKRLDVGKATALAMSYPAFSLIIAVIFVGETASAYQVIGLVVMMAGIYLSTSKDKKMLTEATSTT